MARQPNVLFVMTDQQRGDTIAALGNPQIHTPNFDRLVNRGAFPDPGLHPDAGVRGGALRDSNGALGADNAGLQQRP